MRRRFVQKTLFPHKESAIKECEKVGGGREEEAVGEEEEEERRAGGKKRKATKRNGNSKSKTTPRASPKKVLVLNCSVYMLHCPFRDRVL